MCLCALLVTMTLTGCQSKETFNWSQLSQVQATQTPVPVTENAPLTVAMPEAGGAWDPYTNPSQAMQGLMKLSYESMIRLDDRYQPQNWLAESVKKTEDGYEIVLRGGVLFHDGKGLTAADVEAAFDAIQEAEKGPWKEKTACIEDVVADGERTVYVFTDAGYDGLYALTFPIVNKDSQGDIPGGTGPYVAEKYFEGSGARFVCWEKWWRTPALIPAIEVVAREDEEGVLNTFVTGGIDVCVADMLAVSTVTQRNYISRQEYLTGQAELLLPNVKGQLGDVELRKVVALALDKKDVVTNTYQNHGVAVDVPVLPDSWLAESASAAEHDVEEAVALLESLGWMDENGDGFVERRIAAPVEPVEEGQEQPEEPDALDGLLEKPEVDPLATVTEKLHLTILTNNEDLSSHKDAAGRIAAQLNAVGIETTITSVAFADMQKEAEKGEWDLMLVGYQLPDTGDLSSLLRSDGANNRMGYNNAAMDTALDALGQAQTAEGYYAAMQRVYDLIVLDMPVYTVCMRTKTQVAGENVTVDGIVRAEEPYRNIERWTNLE